MSPFRTRILIVVHRDQAELYARMRDQYADVAFVTLDRRESERRVEVERRVADRRKPWTAEEVERFRRLGYRLFYRAEGSQMDPASDEPRS